MSQAPGFSREPDAALCELFGGGTCPPVVFQGFRHHFVQRVGGGRGVDFVSLTDQIPVDRTNAVAENVNLQFFGGRKSSTVAVLFGNRQSGLVGIFVNKIAEGIKKSNQQKCRSLLGTNKN